MSAMFFRLSKSKYMAALQCHKRLYLETYHPELATAVDEQTESRFETGYEVGEWARKRFPGGILVSQDQSDLTGAISRTADLITDSSIPAIFEATFEYNSVLVRVDVLERTAGNCWRLIEVKSAASSKPEHIDDLAIQAYVVSGAGIELDGCFLMRINTGYCYPGGYLDLAQLFAFDDLTAAVRDRQAAVPIRLSEMRSMLRAGLEPQTDPTYHCHTPYGCQFWDYCTKEKPDRWIYHLPGGQRTFNKVRALGIDVIDDIPQSFTLSAHQQRMKDGKEWVDAALREVLAKVIYPVFHLDFETINFVIPKFPNTRPYEQVPFQWSVHVEEANGAVRHEEYLCADPKDSREELAVRLVQVLGSVGTICVYSGFEKQVLTALGEAVPSLKPKLNRIIKRLYDLLPIVRAHYYHPGFGASYSLKSVLPTLVPSLSYDDLEIQDGGMAGQRYAEMLFGKPSEEEKAKTREALLKYCGRDTYGLVKLRHALSSASGNINLLSKQ